MLISIGNLAKTLAVGAAVVMMAGSTRAVPANEPVKPATSSTSVPPHTPQAHGRSTPRPRERPLPLTYAPTARSGRDQ